MTEHETEHLGAVAVGETADGWAVVPAVATLEMEAAAVAAVKPFHDQKWRSVMPGDLFRLAWPAMLSAATSPARQEPVDPTPVTSSLVLGWHVVGGDGWTDITDRQDIADQWDADGLRVTPLVAALAAEPILQEPIEWRITDTSWMPVHRDILEILGNTSAIKSGLGKLSPASCKKLGMSEEESKAIEALFSLTESQDFYMPLSIATEGTECK